MLEDLAVQAGRSKLRSSEAINAGRVGDLPVILLLGKVTGDPLVQRPSKPAWQALSSSEKPCLNTEGGEQSKTWSYICAPAKAHRDYIRGVLIV